jgi:hypothetical protein
VRPHRRAHARQHGSRPPGDPAAPHSAGLRLADAERPTRSPAGAFTRGRRTAHAPPGQLQQIQPMTPTASPTLTDAARTSNRKL